MRLLPDPDRGVSATYASPGARLNKGAQISGTCFWIFWLSGGVDECQRGMCQQSRQDADER